jgi:phosphoribosylformimino-5-aminoimidazole carboxamide ribotide isomerase
MIIIPAIDIIDGKCVRLTKGDYSQKKIYNEDPLEVAMQFQDAGLMRLHLVDLDGAKAGKVKNWKVLEKIAGKTNLQIDFSGGIGKEADLVITFDSGARFAAIGSMAVKDELTFSSWIIKYGADKFIIGADTKDGLVQVRGWTESTTTTVADLINNYHAKGVIQFFCTDISKDGLLEGPATGLYKTLIEKFPSVHLIASGGVASMNHLHELEAVGCKGAIVGKAIYENRISLSELQKFV